MEPICPSLLDEEPGCENNNLGQHECVLAENHDDDHECDCGEVW